MGMDAFDVRRWCETIGGIARTAELAHLGVDAHSLRAAVRSGELRRVREGVYATPETGADIITAVAHGGTLGCRNRLAEAGLWLLDREDSRVHVSMPRTGRRRPHETCTCVLHWTGGPASGGLAPLIEALAQTLACFGPEDFFVALESAMRKRLIARSAVRSLRSLIPKMHRHLVDLARWNADSGLESLLRLRLKLLGIDLEPQVCIDGVGTVDFVLGDCIVLEVDGVPGHADTRKARHKDLVRDARASTMGFEALRFDYALVVHDWPLVEAAIFAALARAASRSTRMRRSR